MDVSKDVEVSETPLIYTGIPDYDPSRTRLLHVYYDSKLGTKVKVTDDDKSTTLYNVKCRMTKPHLVIESSHSGPPSTNTVSMHTFSSRLDLDMNGQALEMTTTGKWKMNYTYNSLISGAQRNWECTKKGNGLDSVCTDEQGLAIARIRFSNWSLKKVGKLELVESVAQEGPLMDEIVATALAVVQVRLVQVSVAVSSANASAASAASAASVSV